MTAIHSTLPARAAIRSAALLSLIFMTLSGCSTWLRPTLEQKVVEIKPGNYQLDPAHTAVIFKVDHMGFSKFVGRFNEVSATLDFNAEQIELSSLQAIVNVASIDVNNAGLEESLRGRFWLDTERFPQAVFQTTSAQPISDKVVRFQGDLTLMGATHPITVDVTINGAATNRINGKYTMGFSAQAQFARSQFGLDQYLGVVGDNIELEIHSEFQRR